MIFIFLIVFVVGVFTGFMLCGFVFDKQITEELARRRGVNKSPAEPAIMPASPIFEPPPSVLKPPKQPKIKIVPDQELLNKLSSEQRRDLEIKRYENGLEPIDSLVDMDPPDIKRVLDCRRIYFEQ